MKRFILSDKNIVKDGYTWNMLASLLFAFQSVILLIILTRALSLEYAGIFTIGYANASLFLYIGRYGMRNFQISDASGVYKMGEYIRSRVITVACMILVSIFFVFWTSIANTYTLEKSMILLLICFFKVPDAIEDVYFGEYQRMRRLDVAAKAMFIRLAATVFILAVVVCVSHNLLLALIISTIFSFVFMCYIISFIEKEFQTDRECENAKVMALLRNCFPLFLGQFLSFYIGNAPKYAIDAVLSDEVQACYGFVMMPVFVIGLMSNFIFTPIIPKLSEYWRDNEKKLFKDRIFRQMLIVTGITGFCILMAYLLGIPVLSILYNTDLKEYKTELLVLLLGGGFLTGANLMTTVMTIFRQQRLILIGYIVVSAISFLFAKLVVTYYGVMGAAWLYTGLMMFLFIIFLIQYGLLLRKYR